MYALTPTFPSKQQELYSTSTMEYPWLSQLDSYSPTLPSFLYTSFDQSDDIKNLHPHHMYLPHSKGGNSNNDQEAGRGSVLEKKLNHNASERNRRRKLNALYSSLRALLPPLYHKKKLSVPKTVVGVVKYIPEQKQELQGLSRRKEELLKIISIKTATLKHQQEKLKDRAMMDSIDSSSQKMAANWITDTEIAVQIATSKWASISDMLLRLEENGLNVISVSSSVSSTASIFYTLHLEGKVELDEFDVVYVPYSCCCSSSGHASYGTKPDVISLTLTLAKQHQYMLILHLLNSVMAYSANLLNFLVTKHTSALTLQVLGNAKGTVCSGDFHLDISKPGCGYGDWRVLHNRPWGGCLWRDKTQV
ncbi:hypothetical protein Bca4012_015937 [Brassica carinata]